MLSISIRLNVLYSIQSDKCIFIFSLSGCLLLVVEPFTFCRIRDINDLVFPLGLKSSFMIFPLVYRIIKSELAADCLFLDIPAIKRV